MSNLTISGILLGVAAFAACNGDSSNPGAASTDPFVGQWSCTDNLAITFTSPSGAPPQNRTQTSTMNITGTSGKLTASKVKDGGSDCPVSFTSNGSTGTLDPGQTCATEVGITLSYTSGSATVSGNTFTSSFEFGGSGTLSVDGGMVAATVTGTQTSTCSRISAPPGSGNGGTTTGGW